MNGYKRCEACGFDGDIFLEELASIKEHGRCIACQFDEDMAVRLDRLRKEDDPAQAVAVLEASQTELRKENDDD